MPTARGKQLLYFLFNHFRRLWSITWPAVGCSNRMNAESASAPGAAAGSFQRHYEAGSKIIAQRHSGKIRYRRLCEIAKFSIVLLKICGVRFKILWLGCCGDVS
jgi:hypothetical protein